jgi:hypothetical protein
MLRSFLATCDSTRIEGVAKHGGGTTSLSVLSNSDALALARICTGRNVVQEGPIIISNQLPNGKIMVRASRAYRAIDSEATIFSAGLMIESDGSIRMFGNPVGEADDGCDVADDDDEGNSGTPPPKASSKQASTKTKTNKAKAKPKAKAKAKPKAKSK